MDRVKWLKKAMENKSKHLQAGSDADNSALNALVDQKNVSK